MMTPERASDIVHNCPPPYSCDLFEHFVEYYNITNPTEITLFAVLCGFAVAKDCVLE
jgi:hypothetical protein